MKTSDYDYALPQSYIAQEPVEPRDSSRLMIVDRSTKAIEHRIFRDIGEYLYPGDLLVANETRVIPARLHARKGPSGGKVELLLLSRRDERTWETLVKGRKTPVGTQLVLQDQDWETVPNNNDAIKGRVIAWTEAGGRLIQWNRPIDSLLQRMGTVPLPPYIHQPIADPERYQTVYARRLGSVAAPTAGLHFTPELLLSLREKGVQMAFVELDIGLDTFQPVRSERVEEHQIHTERCSLSADTARQVNEARVAGQRVIAVGTTAVRVLETAAIRALSPDLAGPCCAWQTVRAFSGATDLFIYPGFQFRVVDALITNFHLPRSSLLMLVSAFAGRDLIKKAYREAIQEQYRFFSFGDAMFII
jgi:S-adenosylmethionine:tRNA ribosyltransferase-isomerase